jgi:ribosome biogenesis GTPase
MAEGLVIKSTGSWYKIKLDDGNTINARIRGKLRIADIKSTNPVSVGDIVFLDVEPDGEYMITDLKPRKNYIIRKSTNLSKQTHIIAANVDQALLITSLKQPKLKFGFIDRFLMTAEAYGIPAAIVFNKMDLLDEEELDYINELSVAYKKVGYPSLHISVNDGFGLDTIREMLTDKITLFSGHSGVGKSSLLNAMNANIDTRVSTVSDSNEKGKHTTTFAEMFEIANNTYVIDTPGIKNFGLTDMTPEELKNYFPEMVERSENCRFNNCIHMNEPGCAVREAYESSELPWFRYEDYLNFFDEIKTGKF